MVSFAHPLLLQQAALAAAQEAKKRAGRPRQSARTSANSKSAVESRPSSGADVLFSPPSVLGPGGQFSPAPYRGLIPEIPGDSEPITADQIQAILDAAALGLAPFPVAGDLMGGAADAFSLARNPNWLDASMALTGLVPFLPSAGTVKRLAIGKTISKKENKRIRNAADMGFGNITDRDQDLYHGTADMVRAFNPTLSGKVQGTTDLDKKLLQRPAAFLSDDPSVADLYAKDAAKVKGDVGANIMPLRVRADRPMRMNAGGRNVSAREMRASLDHEAEMYLQRTGALPDVVKIENLPPAMPGGRPVTVTVVFDPAKIRSVFARFHPGRASSSSLLAGLAGAGLLVSSSYQSDRDE